MNKQRRKELEKLLQRIEDIKIDLEQIRNDEDEYKDNMPENLMGSQKYTNSDENVTDMDDALGSLSESFNLIEGVINR